MNGVDMDADLNRYDLNHVTTAHDTMSRDDWERAYRLAWDKFYSDEHIITLLRRARASNISVGKFSGTITWFYGSILYESVHPPESGFFRLKYRTDRRPGFPTEKPWIFYPKYFGEMISKIWKPGRLYLKYCPMRRRLEEDPEAANYADLALSPNEEDDTKELEMFTNTNAAREALARAKRRAALRAH